MHSDESLRPESLDHGQRGNASPPYPRWPGVLMVSGGLLLMLGAPIVIWLFRAQLADLSPQALMALWFGAGGLALLFLTAGLPLGAILLAAGGAYLFPTYVRASRILLPLLGIELAFFAFHAIRLAADLSLPFLFFALAGLLILALFVALVWVWARRRPGLEPDRQRAVDLQFGASLCFVSAAWQACGLVGAPGFALYPDIVQKLGNQSFIAGQAVAVMFFMALGFAFLLLSIRAEQPRI